jgi:hypothetical protein
LPIAESNYSNPHAKLPSKLLLRKLRMFGICFDLATPLSPLIFSVSGAAHFKWHKDHAPYALNHVNRATAFGLGMVHTLACR